ncbi:MAG: hypothetical protein KAR42_08010 [candidate division Zixibacteria bacterium]|nr:hypothetical protein [candidate division Zixibacteria bacterium]
MCASLKQIEANRKNALKSTGPKTPEGKDIASQNATRHGLYSNRIIIQSPHYREDPITYEALDKIVNKSLKPESHTQMLLADEIINNLWRSRRAMSIKTLNPSLNTTFKQHRKHMRRQISQQLCYYYCLKRDANGNDTPDLKLPQAIALQDKSRMR